MRLDTTNRNIGYLLGRMFALMEFTQEKAVPGTNATVRDRFFSAASATPARAFPPLMRNTQNWLAKIRRENEKTCFFLDKQLQDLVAELEAGTGFPNALKAEEQGRFMLGYYQQRQALYTKKEATENTEG